MPSTKNVVRKKWYVRAGWIMMFPAQCGPYVTEEEARAALARRAKKVDRPESAFEVTEDDIEKMTVHPRVLQQKVEHGKRVPASAIP